MGRQSVMDRSERIRLSLCRSPRPSLRRRMRVGSSMDNFSPQALVLATASGEGTSPAISAELIGSSPGRAAEIAKTVWAAPPGSDPLRPRSAGGDSRNHRETRQTRPRVDRPPSLTSSPYQPEALKTDSIESRTLPSGCWLQNATHIFPRDCKGSGEEGRLRQSRADLCLVEDRTCWAPELTF
jgi:hypothetical protein